jgi:hypothetical protein
MPFAGLGLPEQAMGWFPLGLVLIVEDNLLNFHLDYFNNQPL